MLVDLGREAFLNRSGPLANGLINLGAKLGGGFMHVRGELCLRRLARGVVRALEQLEPFGVSGVKPGFGLGEAGVSRSASLFGGDIPKRLFALEDRGVDPRLEIA